LCFWPVEETFPRYTLQVGQEALDGEQFSSLSALTKYPYIYISAAYRDRVVKEFFAHGNFYERPWDL
jgi:hypothetical protein